MLSNSATFSLTEFEAPKRAAFSVSVRSYSTISVIPSAPSLAGTPRYTSFMPNSPLSHAQTGNISFESLSIALTMVAADEAGAKYALPVLSKLTISAPPSDVF